MNLKTLRISLWQICECNSDCYLNSLFFFFRDGKFETGHSIYLFMFMYFLHKTVSPNENKFWLQ